MGKLKAGKKVRDGEMHIQPGKEGTMDMNTPYRCSAQPDPPSDAAVTTYVYDGYGKRTCYEFSSTRRSGLHHHPLLEPARVHALVLARAGAAHATAVGADRHRQRLDGRDGDLSRRRPGCRPGARDGREQCPEPRLSRRSQPGPEGGAGRLPGAAEQR